MLLEKHKGLVLPTAMTMGNGVNADGTSLVSTVCNVTISSMAASSCSMEPVIRRLPGSLTVGRLKALCARVFGLDVDLMSLHYKTEVRQHDTCIVPGETWKSSRLMHTCSLNSLRFRY